MLYIQIFRGAIERSNKMEEGIYIYALGGEVNEAWSDPEDQGGDAERE